MMYWLMIPVLLVLIGLVVEMRARRSWQQYPFPERARIIHKAIRAGVDVTITFWSRTQNRFLTREIKPLELQGFYLKGMDKESGAEIAVKVTRIKQIIPDQPLTEEDKEPAPVPVPWEKRRRRRGKNTMPSFFILAGMVGIVIVLAVYFFPKHKVLRIDIDEETQQFRFHKDVPIDPESAVPVLPDAANVSAMTTTVQMWNIVIESDKTHTSLYAQDALRQVFGYPADIADKLALEIERQGKLAVWSGPHELATNYIGRLQKLALIVHLEKIAAPAPEPEPAAD
jgi:ATP-dependent Clp protease adapter protein ClpS